MAAIPSSCSVNFSARSCACAGWLSIKTLIALCDILSCTPADLIDPFVEASSRKPAVGDTNVVDVHPVTAFRPVRARIVDDE